MFKVKKGMRALVVGLGRSGVSVTKLLTKKGIKVKITDERNKTDLLDAIEKLKGVSYRAELGKHVLKSFCSPDFIVVSPGVPSEIKPLKQAEKSGIPILSEVEVASQFINKPIVAVTGTNGKTTVVHLIRDMFEASGKAVFLCGNSGIPLSEAVLTKDRYDFIVAEMSSFQLENTYSLKPAVAVFLNVAPDHLDRHETFENYVKAKMRLLMNLDESDHVVVNLRDPKLMEVTANIKPKVFCFTSDPVRRIPAALLEKHQGMSLESADTLLLKTTRWKDHTFEVGGTQLRGVHNKENIMAAALAAKLCGASNEGIQKAIVSFQPLPHRMEFVARKNQVKFYNDSKGTNVHSMMRSLESFRDEPVILIAGGKDKGEDYSVLEEIIENHVKSLILVGEAKEKLNRAIGDFTETFLVGTFEEAIYLAYQKARSGDVILLSPGCASQDMFKDYEERGNRYKEIVHSF